MSKTGHYHLTGVAGIGMSALAQVRLAEDCTVSGSDRVQDQGSKTGAVIQGSDLDKLQTLGVRLFPQDGSGVTQECRFVIVSTAIEKDNPDLLAAERLDVPVIHRAEMLASLVRDKYCVAVTGTSGKSTVTGMIGWILEQIGADPVVVNGAALLNWRHEDRIGNARTRFRTSERDIWVIEADESDRSLLHFRPEWAVITNASRDHFELDETIELFRTFSGRVKTGLVSSLDTPELLRDFDPELAAGKVSVMYEGVAFNLSVPGRHNAENALMAVSLCERLGFDRKAISHALVSFKGIHRRLETVGTARGITVIDDYAHNPEKIRAAWQTVAPHCRRVLALWRPHGYGPLSKMMDELVTVFREMCRQTDRLYVLSVYDAGGIADRRVNSGWLVEKLCACNIPAVLAEDSEELIESIAKVSSSGDLILVMGARDPALPMLAQKILHGIEENKL